MIITSGEDIYQGANTTPDIIGDSIAAFNYNARLSDMYAWSVINFFDYKYSFGIDTIFRLLDVAMGMGIIYLMTYFALGHKPRLKISDATWFLFCFVMIFLTPHGRTLYTGFSLIHNYLLTVLSLLLFAIPYVRQRMPNKRYAIPLMAIAGYIFGFMSNLAPIAFLITYVVDKIYALVKKKKKQPITTWEISGLIGVLLGVATQYLLGPGLSSYTNGHYATDFDYVSFSQVLGNPIDGLGKLLMHAATNYTRILAPLIACLLVCLAVYVVVRKIKGKSLELKIVLTPKRRLILACLLFVFFYIAITSQIEAPLRIVIPAYTVGVICITATLSSLLPKLPNCVQTTFTALLTIASLAIASVRTATAVNYVRQVSPILDSIKASDQNAVCIPAEAVSSKTIPLIYLAQEPMLVDWAIPETIYGKTITFCD